MQAPAAQPERSARVRILCAITLVVTIAGIYHATRYTAGSLQAIGANAVWFAYQQGEPISSASWQSMAASAQAADALSAGNEHQLDIADARHGLLAEAIKARASEAEVRVAAEQAMTAINAALRRRPAQYRLWINRAFAAVYLDWPAADIGQALHNSFLTAPNAGTLNRLREAICIYVLEQDAAAAPAECPPLPAQTR